MLKEQVTLISIPVYSAPRQSHSILGYSEDPVSHNISLQKGFISMATKLFVGKLSYDVNDDGLRELFAQYGAVESAQVIKDRDTGTSKGFAFVEMTKAEEAQAAINALDGKEFNGRVITVSVARPREDRPRDGGQGFRGGFQRR
jgi:cold-inducible RNA-binding protein